ncbi:hypothetical protein ACHAWF_009922 [Thalassiosira exigua]
MSADSSVSASSAPSAVPPSSSEEHPYASFQAGVTASLRTWSALRTAHIISLSVPSRRQSTTMSAASSSASASSVPSAVPSAVPPSSSEEEHPYASFQAGVTASLRSWSALRTAVEHTWGGPTSASKAEDLRSSIFRFFDGSSPKPKMTPEELEDELSGYMEEEFGVVLEDGSEREVADAIWRMYEGCARGDASLARRVVRDATRGEEVLKAAGVRNVVKSGDDDGDDGMDEDSDAEGTGDAEGVDGGNAASTSAAPSVAARHYASEALFGGPPAPPRREEPPPRQLGEPEPERPRPEVDDDGFAAVASKKKRGKKR